MVIKGKKYFTNSGRSSSVTAAKNEMQSMNPKPFQQFSAPAGDPVADHQNPINTGAPGALSLEEHPRAGRSREGLRRIWRARHYGRYRVI